MASNGGSFIQPFAPWIVPPLQQQQQQSGFQQGLDVTGQRRSSVSPSFYPNLTLNQLQPPPPQPSQRPCSVSPAACSSSVPSPLNISSQLRQGQNNSKMAALTSAEEEDVMAKILAFQGFQDVEQEGDNDEGGANSRYKTEICRNFKERSRCVYGDSCQFAHGRKELRDVVRNTKYKTKPCQKYWITGYCAYGPRCNFLHAEILENLGVDINSIAPGTAVAKALEKMQTMGHQNQRSQQYQHNKKMASSWQQQFPPLPTSSTSKKPLNSQNYQGGINTTGSMSHQTPSAFQNMPQPSRRIQHKMSADPNNQLTMSNNNTALHHQQNVWEWSSRLGSQFEKL